MSALSASHPMGPSLHLDLGPSLHLDLKITASSCGVSSFGCWASHRLTADLWPLFRASDAATLSLVSQQQSAHSGWVNSVTFSPDGTKIASGSEDGSIKLWGEQLWLLGVILPHS